LIDLFFQFLGPLTIVYFFFVYSFAYYRTNHTIISQRLPVNSTAFTLFAIGSTLWATNAFRSAWVAQDFNGSFVAWLGYLVLACWGIATVIINEYIKRRIKRDISMHSAWHDMLDYTDAPMSLYDKFGKPIIWNKALADLTGYSHREVTHYWQEHWEILTLLYKWDELERVRECLQSLGTGYQDAPFTLVTKSGIEKTVHWTTQPYHEWSIRKARIPPEMQEPKILVA
jgi:PAS domain S-box-containing protein